MKICTQLAYRIVTQCQVINPYTYELLPAKPYITEQELYEKISNTVADYRKWRKIPLSQRIALTQKFAQTIIADKQAIKPMISSYIGKSYKNIDEQYRRLKNVCHPLIECSHLALKQLNYQTTYKGKKLQNRVTQEPLGLTVIFPYFSEPIFDSMIHLIPCLIAGNGALLKVSDFSNFIGEYLNQKAKQVFGLSSLVNNTFLHPTQLPIIREFRSIKKVNYAGSQSSAKKIFEQLVKSRFIDCNLFYGGQDAAFVDSTADLELAASEICFNAFYNNGQSYDCIKRVYLHQDIESKFLQILINKILNLNYGDPKNPQVDLGPITIQESVLKFEELLNDAITLDAKCLTGGLTTTDGISKGLFCEPTLLSNCDSSMQITQQQLNAPVLCACTVSNFEEFKKELDQNSYGTGIRIFTTDIKKYEGIEDQIEVGFISFNSGSIVDGDLPIEGWKKSGKGKILSQLSYEEYTVPKSYIIGSLE